MDLARLENARLAVAQRFGHWAELYVSSEFSSRPGDTAIPLKSQTAARFLERTHHLVTLDDLAKSIEPVSRPLTSVTELAQAVIDHRRLLLTGESGAGKTSTLERLALYFATEARDCLPVFLHLSEVGDSIVTAIEEAIGFKLGEVPSAWKVILLLDGLNEVSEHKADIVTRWLEVKDSQIPTIVACRTTNERAKRGTIGRVEISRLDVLRVREFICRYFEDTDAYRLIWRLAGREARTLWDWFQNTARTVHPFEEFWHGKSRVAPLSIEPQSVTLERLRTAYQVDNRLPEFLEFARNPFILFWTVQVFQKTGNLPERRIDLFQEMISLLIKKRGVAADDQRRDIARDTVVALSHIAFEMILERQEIAISEQRLLDYMKSVQMMSSAADVLELAVSVSLLQRVGEKRLRFRHQLLQEYLAALVLRDRYLELGSSAFFGIGEWWKPSRWDHSFEFVAELMRDIEPLITWLAPVRPSLALACYDLPGTSCPPLALTERVANPPRPQVPCPRARDRWARGLFPGSEVLERPGSGNGLRGLPEIRWIEVRGGRFQIGGDDALIDLHDQVRGMQVELKYDFSISAFPVTLRQFGSFVDTGAYAATKYWSAHGARWKGDRTGPERWDDYVRSACATEPVAGINWYEAHAFTRWLTEMLLDDEARKRVSIRLPTETEWERAARYPDDRHYPWGREYLPGHANVDETADLDVQGPYFLGRRTPVGMYELGRSELGIYDLAGNVFEWTSCVYEEQFKSPEDNRINVPASFRSLRGGSWLNSAKFARCTFRDHLDPDIGAADIGFRVVRGPSPERSDP